MGGLFIKYVVRFIVVAFIGYLVGAVLNIALSHGFWDVFWPNLREWKVFDFFSRAGELDGWARFGLMLPVLAGGFAAIRGIGWGIILGALGAAVVVGIIAFVVGFFVVIGAGGILAILLFFGLLAGPGYIVIWFFE